MKDALGNELKVGDIVLFFTRYGTVIWSQYSLILGFTTNNEIEIISAVRYFDRTTKLNTRTGKCTNPQCMVRIDKPELLKELIPMFREWIDNRLDKL